MLGQQEQRGVTGVFKKHECETCGRKFRKVEELMQHQQVAHEPRLYMCNECNMGFEGMEQMRDHAKKFHSYNRMKEKG
ncbi:MAG TPA: C2H2-type zinc finger protein [Nitrososphaera sp.]|nr:C2H2-type zinc finger protein [Nitrososphaera sp.]